MGIKVEQCFDWKTASIHFCKSSVVSCLYICFFFIFFIFRLIM
jgi:hypothetical protein